MIRSFGLSIDRHLLLSFGRGTVPKRYLIRSYFEPRVSDRSVSYPQVTQFYIVKREAAPFWRGVSQLITSVKRVRVANEPPLGGDTEIRTPVTDVTGRCNNHYTISPEKE